MPFSESYSNNILNCALGKTEALPVHNEVWIGLSANDPEADEGVFNELSGNGYSRVLISQLNRTYPNVLGSASDREIKNNYQINWTKATADWPEAKGMGLFTSQAGGSPFYYGKLEEGVTTIAGAIMLFDPQMLKIKLPSVDTLIATVAEE